MTLEDALAVYLYLQVVDTIGKREERICDAAWKIIERQGRRATKSFLGNGSDRAGPSKDLVRVKNRKHPAYRRVQDQF